jgi:hypothetical protein
MFEYKQALKPYLPQKGCARGKHEHSIHDQTNGDHVPVATGGVFWVENIFIRPMLFHRLRLELSFIGGLVAPK